MELAQELRNLADFDSNNLYKFTISDNMKPLHYLLSNMLVLIGGFMGLLGIFVTKTTNTS